MQLVGKALPHPCLGEDDPDPELPSLKLSNLFWLGCYGPSENIGIGNLKNDSGWKLLSFKPNTLGTWNNYALPFLGLVMCLCLHHYFVQW